MNRITPKGILLLLTLVAQWGANQAEDIDQFSTFPFPSGLTGSPSGDVLAWAMAEEGKRNIYMAKAPEFSPLRLTSFEDDDGQEISSLQFTPDGDWLVFVRGGEDGGRNASNPVNPCKSRWGISSKAASGK
ncbi:TolB-like translocation protein [Pleomorphovibrio marinus]|uniref:hypothetical protein n=1 Tax=Pleomorphovibrio marinus TaxID=2164132 RepID=UPI000E0AE97B|nr:hypothetical protein [Pleomorphovibrio marinus]